MADRVTYTFRLKEATNAALVQMAENDHRSLNNMVEVLILAETRRRAAAARAEVL